jgi:UDP-N-acetylmuramate dehydrogenase
VLRIQNAVPLGPRTTLELGGRAEVLIEVGSLSELDEALKWATDSSRSVKVLGGGSNVVIADEGCAGVVVVPTLRGIDIDRRGNHVLVTAAAGEVWDEVVSRTVSEGVIGLECLSGIPGTVGATPIQNVGAYGVEISDVLEWVEVVDRTSGDVSRLSAAECAFGYRTSWFKQNPDQLIVTRVAFRLQSGGLPVIRYRELQRAVEMDGSSPDASVVRDTVMALRRAKGMVLEENAPRSVGSFFVNPLVDAETLAIVEEKAGSEEIVPRFEAGEHLFKIPAAWLIERAGFCRGFRQGPVGISEHHALALVHHGGGRTADLVALATAIRDGVASLFGLRLRPEPVFWGFGDAHPLDGGA